jgi:hypothetical protein
MATPQSKSGIATAKRGLTGKQKAAAAKAAPVNGKGEGEVVAPVKKAKEPKPQAIIPIIKQSAMSLDVGPRVISGLMQVSETEAEANKLMSQVANKRYDLLAQLTQGIVKAAKADKTISLAAYFSKDPKQVNAVNDQLGLALGFRKVASVGEGEKARQRVVLADEVAKLFPQESTTKGTQAFNRRATVISNFLHTLKKCAQAAEGIISKDMKMSLDKATGTLRLSGPTIKTTFGQDSVLLNEKQTIGEGDKKKKLNAKPSFTSIADIGAREHGVVMQVRKDSRASAADPVLSFVSVCTSLVSAIGKLGDKPDSRQVEALASVQNAIDKWGGLVEKE